MTGTATERGVSQAGVEDPVGDAANGDTLSRDDVSAFVGIGLAGVGPLSAVPPAVWTLLSTGPLVAVALGCAPGETG